MVDRPQLIVCSLGDDRAAALDSARLLVTQYLGQQPNIMKASGVPETPGPPMATGIPRARNTFAISRQRGR